MWRIVIVLVSTSPELVRAYWPLVSAYAWLGLMVELYFCQFVYAIALRCWLGFIPGYGIAFIIRSAVSEAIYRTFQEARMYVQNTVGTEGGVIHRNYQRAVPAWIRAALAAHGVKTEKVGGEEVYPVVVSGQPPLVASTAGRALDTISHRHRQGERGGSPEAVIVPGADSATYGDGTIYALEFVTPDKRHVRVGSAFAAGNVVVAASHAFTLNGVNSTGDARDFRLVDSAGNSVVPTIIDFKGPTVDTDINAFAILAKPVGARSLRLATKPAEPDAACHLAILFDDKIRVVEGKVFARSDDGHLVYHTATTHEGHSGAPLVSGGVVLGMHWGYSKMRNANLSIVVEPGIVDTATLRTVTLPSVAKPIGAEARRRRLAVEDYPGDVDQVAADYDDLVAGGVRHANRMRRVDAAVAAEEAMEREIDREISRQAAENEGAPPRSVQDDDTDSLRPARYRRRAVPEAVPVPSGASVEDPEVAFKALTDQWANLSAKQKVAITSQITNFRRRVTSKPGVNTGSVGSGGAASAAPAQ